MHAVSIFSMSESGVAQTQNCQSGVEAGKHGRELYTYTSFSGLSIRETYFTIDSSGEVKNAFVDFLSHITHCSICVISASYDVSYNFTKHSNLRQVYTQQRVTSKEGEGNFARPFRRGNFTHTIRLEMILCGRQDVKIQELYNPYKNVQNCCQHKERLGWKVSPFIIKMFS